MEHYITKIDICELRHLSNIVINLNQEQRQHLILTGKNGSGKTSLLLAIQQYLLSINDGKSDQLINHIMPELGRLEKIRTSKEPGVFENEYQSMQRAAREYYSGVKICFNNSGSLDSLYQAGDYIIAFFFG